MRDIVNHLILGEAMVKPFLGGEADDVQRLVQLGVADPIQGWKESSDQATLALRAPGSLNKTYTHPVVGTMPGSQLARFRLVDNVVHSWDLAAATGNDRTIAPTIADTIYAAISRQPESIARGPSTFAAAIDVDPQEPAQTKLLGMFGREADWSPQAPAAQ